ncbi:MAG: hypothetical protein FJY20_03600 [Bacteroidetes bacterium]|nr:hypothetical protein [Bacteroidota bacterium]
MRNSFFLLCLFSLASPAQSQKVSSNLKFEQGQVLEITLQVKTSIAQQAMGQAIDFTMDATGDHFYKITNATDDNTTLNHGVQRIRFTFDGMGQKRNFDSNEEKDLNGPFGKPVKDLLEKKYDMVIDPAGRVLMVLPEKMELNSSDGRMMIIGGMMKDVFNVGMPPKKGLASFFKVLPDTATSKSEPWTQSYSNETGQFDEAYNISDINDSTIVVDFATGSVTVTRAEIMGNATTTTMNNKSTGKIIIDRATGIVKEKTETTESAGNTESSFGTVPVTSKTITTVTVKAK